MGGRTKSLYLVFLILLEKREIVKRQSQDMGAEPLPTTMAAAPLILGLQPAALSDHVARVDWSLLDQIPGERGGSIPVFLLILL